MLGAVWRSQSRPCSSRPPVSPRAGPPASRHPPGARSRRRRAPRRGAAAGRSRAPSARGSSHRRPPRRRGGRRPRGGPWPAGRRRAAACLVPSRGAGPAPASPATRGAARRSGASAFPATARASRLRPHSLRRRAAVPSPPSRSSAAAASTRPASPLLIGAARALHRDRTEPQQRGAAGGHPGVEVGCGHAGILRLVAGGQHCFHAPTTPPGRELLRRHAQQGQGAAPVPGGRH